MDVFGTLFLPSPEASEIAKLNEFFSASNANISRVSDGQVGFYVIKILVRS